MAYTAIDIRNEQRLAFDAQYNLAKVNGKSDDEAIAIANDASDTVGAQLYQQFATGIIEPVNPYINNNIYPPESPLYVKGLDISVSNEEIFSFEIEKLSCIEKYKNPSLNKIREALDAAFSENLFAIHEIILKIENCYQSLIFYKTWQLFNKIKGKNKKLINY
jgi:hypothetical protein